MESAQLYIHEIIFILLLSNDIEINVDLINRLKTQMTKSQLNTTIYSILLTLMRVFIENSKDMLSIMNKEEVKIFIKNMKPLLPNISMVLFSSLIGLKILKPFI